MTEKEQIAKVNDISNELLRHFNKAVLGDSEFDIHNLPIEPINFYDSLAEIGMLIENLIQNSGGYTRR